MVIILVLYIFGTIWMCWNVTQMKKLTIVDTVKPFVSILIPLRNEESHIKNLIKNLQALDYTNIEFILYDDDSDDDTLNKAIHHTATDHRFQIIKGGLLPNGWKGKPHACHQLSSYAQGDIYLFLDADVLLKPQTVDAVIASMVVNKADAISCFPHFRNSSFLEYCLTPLLHFFIYMHLPIRLSNNQKLLTATAASGAFIAVTSTCYHAIGGHTSVKNNIVEDVTLFQNIKKNHFNALLLRGSDFVECKMYGSSSATWQGFLKNCFAAFHHSYLTAIAIIFVYTLYYLSPFALLIYGLFSGQWWTIIPYLCITIQRLISDYLSKNINLFSLLMPLSAALYIALLLTAMYKYTVNDKTSWKGRLL